MAATPLPCFVTSFRGLLQEESGLPKVHTSDGFDSNAYKLMNKFGYEFSKPPPLGNVIEARPYELNSTQKMIQKTGWHGSNTKNWPWLYAIPIGENFKITEREIVTRTIHHDERS